MSRSTASICFASALNPSLTDCFWVTSSSGMPVKQARDRAIQACARWQVDGGDLALVLAELLNNAFEYGGLGTTDRVTVRILWRKHLREFELVIVVPQPACDLPELSEDVDAENGRGLTLVRALTREFACVEHCRGYQTLTAVLDAA